MSSLGTTRRAFLKAGLAVGGGLLLSATTACSSGGTHSYRAARAGGKGSAQINAWLHITPDSEMIFYLDKAEMGQGVSTGLPVLIAEELEIDPAQLQLHMAPVDDVYKNPMLGLQVTGGSTSVRSSWELLQKMGASAREMLLVAAAHHWGVPKAELHTQGGVIFHRASDRSAGFGEFAGAAAALPIPEQVALKSKQDYKLIGKYDRRLDTEVKISGEAPFGIDIDLPGALVAVVVRSPAFGGRVKAFAPEKARAVDGVTDVVDISTGVAVVASGYWPARKGANALEVEWDLSEAVSVGSDEILSLARKQAQAEGKTVHARGDAGKALAAAGDPLEAEYYLPYLAHATMEPMNCTASVTGDECHIWVPTQGAGLIPGMVAGITGLPTENIHVHTTFLGGGFGRRAMFDFVVEAVEISARIKQPVKVIWSREDDMRHDYYRPMALHKLRGAVGADGAVSAWEHCVVSPSIEAQITTVLGRAFFPGWIPAGLRNSILGGARYLQESFSASDSAVEGADEVPYGIENLSVQYTQFDPGVPVGYWRSVGHSHTAFAVESFIDELAHKAGQDPVQYRRDRLAAEPRHRRVLELAARHAGWGNTEAGIFQGVSVHKSFGSYVAQVADISISDSGKLSVYRVVCVIDCGQVINPDIVKMQMESGIVFGLTAVLYGVVDIEQGRVKQSNFHDYPLLRLNESPAIEVYLVDSDEPPGGVGEPGTPPIAAAVTNAIFAATGKRIRTLPLQGQQLG